MGARQLSARDGCVGGRGPHGRRCQLVPAPRACWGSLCCGETARRRLAPCQPPPPLWQSVYPAASPGAGGWECSRSSGRGGRSGRGPRRCGRLCSVRPRDCGGAPGLPTAWVPAPRSAAWGALTIVWPGTRAWEPQWGQALSFCPSCPQALSLWPWQCDLGCGRPGCLQGTPPFSGHLQPLPGHGLPPKMSRDIGRVLLVEDTWGHRGGQCWKLRGPWRAGGGRGALVWAE